jgi:Skp family chaperone for outer membrane proteins
MEIRVLDFDILTKNYTNYQEGLKNIAGEKNQFITKLGPIKSEMESIINAAKSGLVLDPNTQRQKEQKFSELQQEAMLIDGDFKAKMRELHDTLNKTTFDELTSFVNEWAKENSIDLVTGKMEVVFANEKYDATNDILEILKSKDLYVEYTEEAEVEETTVNDQITDAVTQTAPQD